MTIPERDTKITGVFAETANTTIPDTPVTGASYRDIGMSKAEANKGFAYKEIVDSSKFNQALYEYSKITSYIEKYGFVPWSALTDYEAGSKCLGTDGNVYNALQATGPSTTAYNPVNDTSNTYWEIYLVNQFLMYTLTDGTATPKINSVNKITISQNTTFTLPTPQAGVENQIKIYCEIIGTPTIDWGTTMFYNGKEPESDAGNYVLYYDYDFNLSSWVVGQLSISQAQ